MTTRVGATEAARTLGVTKPTLYAYVSRGLLSRTVAVDGRTSLYDRAEIEALAHRSRRSAPVERPSIDVQITTGITQLHDDSPTYRGHRVVDLVETHRFEQVADLLLTGELGGDRHHWQIDRAALDRSMRIATAAAPCDPITTLSMTALSLGDRSPDDRSPDDRSPDDVASVARGADHARSERARGGRDAGTSPTASPGSGSADRTTNSSLRSRVRWSCSLITSSPPAPSQSEWPARCEPHRMRRSRRGSMSWPARSTARPVTQQARCSTRPHRTASAQPCTAGSARESDCPDSVTRSIARATLDSRRCSLRSIRFRLRALGTTPLTP